MEKCKWICLRPNNPQTRYSLGRKLLKHLKDRRAGCKMVASDSCRDQGGMGLEDGWSFREAYVEVGVDLILGLPRLSPFLTRSRPILVSVGVGWGKVHCEIGVWRKQVTFQPSGICYGVSYPNCIFFHFYFYYMPSFNLFYFNKIDFICQKNIQTIL